MSLGARAFATTCCLAATGGAAFGVGLGAAFRGAGNWSDHLALLGIVLLALAMLSNVVAFFAGAIHLFRSKRMTGWWIFSVVMIMASVYGGWVALHL